MKPLTEKQQEVFDALKTMKQGSATGIATVIHQDPKTVAAHLRRLAKMGHVHVSGWMPGRYNGPMKLYTCGAGEAAPRAKKEKKALSQDEARKAFNKRNSYDPDAPIVPNTGWVSMIHSKDYSMNHSEHIRFMERFQPHPDHASTWLFNQPAVELLGAKYDLVQA